MALSSIRIFARRSIRPSLPLLRKQSTLKSPQLSRWQRTKEYFSDTNNCVFTRDLKPWQRIVCGCVGVCACGAGVVIGGAVIGVAAIGIVNVLEHTILSVCDLVGNNGTGNTNTSSSNTSTSTINNVFNNIIITGKKLYQNFPEAVSDPLQVIGAAGTSGLFGVGMINSIKSSIPEIKPFLHMVMKMENCCDIIRTTAKGSLNLLFATSFITMTILISGAAGIFAVAKCYVIRKKYEDGVYVCDVRKDDVPFVFHPLHF